VKRETSFLATLTFFVVTVPLFFAQDPRSQQNPAPPPEIIGAQLIAWSQLQKPQPVPQPLPPPDRPQSPDPPSQPSHSIKQAPEAQTFAGTIEKDGNRYVLKVSSNSVYELDDQEKAKQYVGKQVKIGGTLDAKGSSLHIISIELVS
jgi:hypothetical protein